jgi:hypothetical protein
MEKTFLAFEQRRRLVALKNGVSALSTAKSKFSLEYGKGAKFSTSFIGKVKKKIFLNNKATL